METAKSGIFSKVKKSMLNKLKRISYSSILGAFVGVALTISAIDINVDASKVLLVKVKDKPIGYLHKIQDYNNIIDVIKATDGEWPLKFISASKVKADGVNINETKEIERTARKELGLKMPGVVVYIDGEETLNLGSQEDVDKMIEGVKEYYISNIQYKNIKIINTNIKEKITASTNMLQPGTVLTIDEAVKKIVGGKGVEKICEIKKGDTLWDLAIINNTTIEDIQAANRNMDINKLKPGQKIKLQASEPYLNVEIAANVTARETIPYDTQEVKDKNIYTGSKKVKLSGKNGIAEVEKKLTIVNGDVMNEEMLNKVVVSAPVNQVVAVGSKKRPYYLASSSNKNVASSGKFMRPSRGSYTSYFGRRPRYGYHTGIDIAGPTGTPVHAADGGVVTFAGWNGNYGRCVIISHGNGYQTLYGHQSKISVKSGQKVSKGQTIGAVGSTGKSTGPHLHFEVRKNGSPQNPLRYIK